MALPTKRGVAMLVLALVFYVNARLFGTFELYLLGLGLGFLTLGVWVWTLIAALGVTVAVRLEPRNPVAGDALEMHVAVRNRSWLPLPGCETSVSLELTGGGEVVVATGAVWPGRTRGGSTGSMPVWRGVYDLDPPVCVIVDPLGLARRRLVLRERPQVVVFPRLPLVESFNVAAARLLGIGAVSGTGGRGAGEFRTIRAHQPGEPLNRIHWPSTARLGSLMLREMEDAPRADGMVVLDGSRHSVVGERPDDTFEREVELAGALADGVLRRGRPVMVLAHGAEDRFLNLEPTPSDHLRLLQTLAAATASAAHPVGEAVARAMAYGAHVNTVVVVSSGHDQGLLASLQHLNRSRVGVLLVHVSAASYLGQVELGQEESRFLARLQGIGIPVLIVRKDDEPGAALSTPASVSTSGGALRRAG